MPCWSPVLVILCLPHDPSIRSYILRLVLSGFCNHLLTGISTSTLASSPPDRIRQREPGTSECTYLLYCLTHTKLWIQNHELCLAQEEANKFFAHQVIYVRDSPRYTFNRIHILIQVCDFFMQGHPWNFFFWGEKRIDFVNLRKTSEVT